MDRAVGVQMRYEFIKYKNGEIELLDYGEYGDNHLYVAHWKNIKELKESLHKLKVKF